MRKNKFIIGLFIAVLIISIVGCGSSEAEEAALNLAGFLGLGE